MIDKDLIDELASELVQVPGEKGGKTPSYLNENVSHLLTKCNGGHSRDGYFHFFGNRGDVAHDIDVWNSAALWKKYCVDSVLDFCFFAEDIFGNRSGTAIPK